MPPSYEHNRNISGVADMEIAVFTGLGLLLAMAWLSWIVARLGGWNCYYKPPGPKTMRAGWDKLAAMATGYHLAMSVRH